MALLPPEMVFAADGTKVSTQGPPGQGSCLHLKKRKKWSLEKMFLRFTLVSLPSTLPCPICQAEVTVPKAGHGSCSQAGLASMSLADSTLEDPPSPSPLRGQLLRGRGGLQAGTATCSASGSKMHREASVVWLACRFTDILYHKTSHILA